jgi:ribosomal protein S18 acetylase RimI-like enzyme
VVELLGTMRQNMGTFYRLLGERSPGGTVFEQEGLLAAVVPSCPNQSVVNAVVYEHAETLRMVRDELEAIYARAGVGAWRIWVPESDRATAEWLERSGHRLSGAPRAMAMELVGADFEVGDDLEWERTGDVAALAAINDQAYGGLAGEFTEALQGFADDPSRLYFAREGEELAACVAAIDEGNDCGIYCVATRPAFRGRGLASGLMCHALSEARSRGCATSTLQSSQMAVRLYQRLGYRDLGAIETWEHQRP